MSFSPLVRREPPTVAAETRKCARIKRFQAAFQAKGCSKSLHRMAAGGKFPMVEPAKQVCDFPHLALRRVTHGQALPISRPAQAEKFSSPAAQAQLTAARRSCGRPHKKFSACD
ncbi:hypothetical protein [Burkholderia glumae]|uniref:hypothetical protein n=1 Tax=Burkholderia glumae TaxID=337 RepID=UPI001462DD16|nr:hypothetical protein [Burkholderia glumae]QJP70047.1 hypothetical protein HJC54_06905 [Burkholderia glumae]